VIYQVRRGALTRASTWRLEDGVLIEDGARSGRYPLAGLKRARLAQGADRLAPGERILMLSFGRRRIVIGSSSYAGLTHRVDQTETFAPFVRAVLSQAAEAAPKARYTLAGDLRLGIYGGVLAILGAGLVLTLAATLAAGEVPLGVNLAARMSFVLILMLTPLPWLDRLGRKSFDPRAIPDEVLS